jgi:hypothetical protein
MRLRGIHSPILGTLHSANVSATSRSYEYRNKLCHLHPSWPFRHVLKREAIGATNPEIFGILQ